MPSAQAKNRRPSAARRRADAGGKPFWSGFFSGAVVGTAATVAIVYWLVNISGGDIPLAIPAAGSAPVPTVDFEFMYRLPKERVVTNVEPYPQAAGPLAPEVPEDDPATEYLLQVAAFRGLDDASAMRAQMILTMNMGAQIESARDPAGGTWHRVFVGPFEGKPEMQRALATLQEMDVSALPLERPKSPGDE